MNAFLWVLQALLAIHTLMGALWKFANSAAVLPFANPIPEAGWYVLSVLEILCSIALIWPAIKKSAGFLVPIAALVIAIEMIVFTVLHVIAQHPDYGPMIYWLVVALVCLFLAYARRYLRPIKGS